jgi:hypothetical protein
MNPISEVKREDFINKMFPYKMDFSFVTYWIDESLPLDQQVEQKIEKKMAENLPCSVQAVSISDYEREYVVLSPCLNLTPGEAIPSGAQIKVYMNGKTNTATMREILSIDNLEVYETCGYKIGCKIRVGTGAKWTW